MLERLTASLCDTVLGQTGSQQVLEALQRSNLFVVPLDSQRRWYRYHALFAEALRSRLEQVEGTSMRELHLRASRWCFDQGDIAGAVQYSLSASDWERTADLIETVAHTLTWRQGERTTVQHWLERLPQDIVRARPRLCFAWASSLFVIAPPTTLEPWLEAAKAGLTISPSLQDRTDEGEADESSPPDDQDHLLGEVLAFQAFITSFSGDGRANLTQCQNIAAYLPEEHLLAHGWLTGAEAQIYRSQGARKSKRPSPLSLKQYTWQNQKAIFVVSRTKVFRWRPCFPNCETSSANWRCFTCSH